MPSILLSLSLLSCRWDLGRAERERNMLSLPICIRRPSLFVCFYWDVAPIEKEESCSVRSPLERPWNPCGTHTDAMAIILNPYTLWLLPKCGFFKTDRNSAVKQHGGEESQQRSWACLWLLPPSPRAWVHILPSQKVTQKLWNMDPSPVIIL